MLIFPRITSLTVYHTQLIKSSTLEEKLSLEQSNQKLLRKSKRKSSTWPTKKMMRLRNGNNHLEKKCHGIRFQLRELLSEPTQLKLFGSIIIIRANTITVPTTNIIHNIKRSKKNPWRMSQCTIRNQSITHTKNGLINFHIWPKEKLLDRPNITKETRSSVTASWKCSGTLFSNSPSSIASTIPSRTKRSLRRSIWAQRSNLSATVWDNQESSNSNRELWLDSQQSQLSNISWHLRFHKVESWLQLIKWPENPILVLKLLKNI